MKKMTGENDLVLIYLEGVPLTYARVESILPDVKKNWYHVRLLLLQVPLQVVIWILKDRYIDGDTFTMGGKEMRLERVIPPEIPEMTDEDRKGNAAGQMEPPSENSNVIALFGHRKNEG
ncbi:MAG: hypothetical protein CSA22_00800 [Deltaproteobacteria bacterium]|nr:MAG: hypothetical protein CSA22_00800 [Deltaproteobacteria bacterium]